MRTDLADRRTARVLFFVSDGRIELLRGFIKKTRTTPSQELALARKRMSEMMS